MKVYLDTCILSRLLDMNIDDAELKALDVICDDPRIDLVTSEKTLEEFLNTTNDKRKLTLKVLYKIITKVNKMAITYEAPALFGEAMFGEAMWGGGVTREKPLFKQLKDIFDSDDAMHIFQAISNKCDYFLTYDNKTILSRVKKNMKRIKLIAPNTQIVKPSELLLLIKTP